MKPVIIKGDRLLKQICLLRAEHRCEKCTSSLHELDPHHLLPKSVYPQHRHNPENIVILCRRKCHNLAELNPVKFLAEIRLKLNLKDRVVFYDENKDINPHPVSVDYEENLRQFLNKI